MVDTNGHPCRVLVGPARRETRSFLAALLVGHGYETLEVEDGPAALRALRRGEVDAAFVGVGLPGGGLDLVRAARRHGRGLPVLAVAAAGDADRAAEALRLGAAAALTEPLREGDVLAALGQALDGPAADGRGALEARLFQAQKLAVVGQVTSEFAHDLNNMVTIILGFGAVLPGLLPPTGPAREAADEICKAADRAGALTRQLLAFSRAQPTTPQYVNLNSLVTSLEKMLRCLLREDVELELALDPALGAVHADPTQLEQVVMNLVLNARDAMPNGGRLTLRTANRNVSAPTDPRDGPPLAPGPYVTLVVADTGCGMGEEVRRRLFEPFFTTKGNGRGTGLGLTIVDGAVKRCNGAIRVASAPGRGSEFTIFLPRAAGTGPAAAGPVPAVAAAGSETVLVVEDNEAVRTIACAILRRHGYRVLEARQGVEALRLCSAHCGAIDLLVTDLVMPHMSGFELAERLRPAWPKMKVLYVSGYPADEVGGNGTAAAFLPKPFTADALVRKVRGILDEVKAG